VPRDQTYCQLMLDGRLPNVIPDMAADPRADALPAAPKATPRAYASVPLTLSDGRLYGTLCAVSRQPVALDDRAVHFLTVLARLIADQLERETAALAILEEGRARIGRRSPTSEARSRSGRWPGPNPRSRRWRRELPAHSAPPSGS
jgi:GAF domain-containing protein